jgi:2-keto-4-pentenoate hydratase/2-oxohepta-3-ene-1,7-dioic acid hydratase in catechol pathway
MRIGRVHHEGGLRTAVFTQDGAAQVLAGGIEVLDLLVADAADRGQLSANVVAELAPDEAAPAAPLHPASIRDFSVFEQHIEGAIKTAGGVDARVPEQWYELPFCYFSNPHAITGPGDEIAVPPGCQAMDLELEVGAIIGRAARNVSVEEARSLIVGYTIFNDWSARDLGGKEIRMPFGQCKGKDFANTLGPWIVTPDELEPYRDGDRFDLDMRASVNGVELGDDTMANMAWSWEELVVYATRGAWIHPGDVLGSGTSGYGCLLEMWGRNGSFSDPAPLKPGDEVSLTVEGIGTLVNTVVAGPEAIPIAPARPGRRRHRAAA